MKFYRPDPRVPRSRWIWYRDPLVLILTFALAATSAILLAR